MIYFETIDWNGWLFSICLLLFTKRLWYKLRKSVFSTSTILNLRPFYSTTILQLTIGDWKYLGRRYEMHLVSKFWQIIWLWLSSLLYLVHYTIFSMKVVFKLSIQIHLNLLMLTRRNMCVDLSNPFHITLKWVAVKAAVLKKNIGNSNWHRKNNIMDKDISLTIV